MIIATHPPTPATPPCNAGHIASVMGAEQVCSKRPPTRSSNPIQSSTPKSGGNQYFENEAKFFEIFNNWTGRIELYIGYMGGLLANINGTSNNRSHKIALDFGCGTGGLTAQLPRFGYEKVYGFDPSKDMLEVAYKNAARNITSAQLTQTGRLEFLSQIPNDAFGRCDLVTAVHVQYHFDTLESLRKDYFGKISSLLSDNGVAIVIASPETSIRSAQDNTIASINKHDIPKKVLKSFKYDKEQFPEDMYGDILIDNDYIPARMLPNFRLKDGARMKVTFSLFEPLPPQHITVYDTFWHDQTVDKAAKDEGLEFIHRVNMGWRGYENTYRLTMYRKRPSPHL